MTISSAAGSDFKLIASSLMRTSLTASPLAACRSSHIASSLTCGVSPCRIRIQALNSLGAGPFSHTFKLKTKPLPPQPPRLECTAFSHQTLRLKWGDGPAKASSSDALQYQLQMGDKSGRSVAWWSGDGKSAGR